MPTLPRVRAVVARHVRPPGDDDLLQIDSLELVSIVEDLEDTFGLQVRAADLVPEHFGSVAAIARFVQERAR